MLLRDKDRLALHQIFDSIDFPLEVWAYGSRVTGSAHEASDLDLVIRSLDLQKLPLGILNGVRTKIQHSNIPILIDIFDWAQLPVSFQQNILAGYEVLYKNEKSTHQF